MEQYIPKSALVAEIERLRKIQPTDEFQPKEQNKIDWLAGKEFAIISLQVFLDTLEVKEIGVDLGDPKGDKSAKHIIDTKTLEVKEVDLTEEIEKCLKQYSMLAVGKKDFTDIAKHFFELGVRKKKEEKYEVPSVSKTEDVSVTSRMAMIDDDLKPIAEFILDYAGWNLHKDEWNHPVLEVPLFRVLDALIQRGKPYCGKN